jgi:predicted DNA-binding antitoxin AbrB/MazE fold protein
MVERLIMVVKAIYQDGVFKPLAPVNLSDGQQVELEIVGSFPQIQRNVVSLQGIWKDHLRPQDQGDWVSDTLTEIRNETSKRLNQLAQQLGKSLNHEP